MEKDCGLPDSTTTIDSPFLTLSPGALSQLTILPWVIVDERAGIKTSFTAFIVCKERRLREATRRALLGVIEIPVLGLDTRLMEPDCAIVTTIL